MPGMSIGEVARRMGLRPSAIRYYERPGLIAKAPRVSGRRQYDDHVRSGWPWFDLPSTWASVSPRSKCCAAGFSGTAADRALAQARGR
jgi:MerR-like DNA binding protein